MATRCKGVVKWFSTEKGYGFIERSGQPDIFVHYTGIRGDGKTRRELFEGQTVEFDAKLGRTDKMEAHDVVVVTGD